MRGDDSTISIDKDLSNGSHVEVAKFEMWLVLGAIGDQGKMDCGSKMSERLLCREVTDEDSWPILDHRE